MEHKPDSIRAILLVFAIGLAITAFTSLQASEDKRSTTSAAGVLVSSADTAPVVRPENR
ncbi:MULTISPECIES: hypothetical protein [Marinobacter]|jgi:uncharacterized membrane protein|uniref:hypothetical protein n=1 Tax=Marinobacter TaxID=2742 RepID=UPI0020038D25|nr:MULTISPECIES: hypothetical protein [Marinobacter]MCK7550355.1 hypothetical protein [Marinobacter goseongensis]MDV3502439.1 hypothetical protein [Marinobacter sp. M-5]